MRFRTDKDVVEIAGSHTCYTCGRQCGEVLTAAGWLDSPRALRGFYGQTFCSRTCSDRFVSRMHASQDAHARGGFAPGREVTP